MGACLFKRFGLYAFMLLPTSLYALDNSCFELEESRQIETIFLEVLRLHQEEEGSGIENFPEIYARYPKYSGSLLYERLSEFNLNRAVNQLTFFEREIIFERLRLHEDLMYLGSNGERMESLIPSLPEFKPLLPSPGDIINGRLVRRMIAKQSPSDLRSITMRLQLHNELMYLGQYVEGLGSLMLRFPEFQKFLPGPGRPITHSYVRAMIGELSPQQVESVRLAVRNQFSGKFPKNFEQLPLQTPPRR
jgi:hypothetical protein